MSAQSTPAVSTIRPTASGVLCAAGGLLFVGLAVAGGRVGAIPGFDLWMALAAAGLAGVVVGVVGLARSGLAGRGPLARVGVAAATLGMAIFLIAHAIAAVDPSQSQSPVFPAGGVLGAIGMLLTGAAVLRARRWSGPSRFAPLACGLYPFLVLMPAFAIFGEPNFPAIAGFGLCWLLLGVSLVMTPSGLDEAPRNGHERAGRPLTQTTG